MKIKKIDGIIACSIINGESSTSIALNLDVDERTIRRRWANVIKKLGCSTSEQAAAKIAVVFEGDHTGHKLSESSLFNVLEKKKPYK